MHTAARTPPAHEDRPRSKDMLISPNLRAALEYDELARASEGPSAPASRRPSLTAGGPAAPAAPPPPALGLPPPPRPKSRASLHKSRSPPMTPTSPLTTQDTAPASAHSSPGSATGHVHAHDAPTNPYINPTPRLAHLYAAVPPPATPPHALAHSRSLSLPANVVRRASADARALGSGGGGGVARPPQSASKSPPGTPPGSMTSPALEGVAPARPGFQRHLRYLASLQKVEKMLVKGRTRAVGRGVDGGARGGEGGRSEAAREARAAWRATAGAGSEGWWPMTAHEEGRRSVGVGALPNADPAAAIPRLPLRPLISHGRRASAASTVASEDDEQSHHPASPVHASVSVSSTLYHDSIILHDAPLAYSPHSDHQRSPTMPPDSDRDSFIDLASPTFSPRLIDFASNASHEHHHHHPYATHAHNADTSRSRTKPTLPAISTAVSHKPPIPTSPKPDFKRRSRSAQPPHKSSRDDTLDSPSVQEITYTRVRPPTTNLLNPVERADKVRSTRKLAQVFGQPPANAEAVAMSHLAYEANAPNALLCAPTTGLVLGGSGAKRGHAQLKHHRGAVSMSVAQGGSEAPQPLWPPPEPDASRYVALNARRHSTPLTPDTFMFMDEDLAAPERSSLDSDGSRHSSDIIEVSSRRGTPHSDWSSLLEHGRRSVGPGSPTSFMDLSEEDALNDGVSSIITIETPKADRRAGLVNSSSASIYSFTSEDLAEEDRRRKREKLAKLHRFLGSRVPVDVVLQQLSLDSTLHHEDLPPLSDDLPAHEPHPYARMELDTRKTWVRRRRSSSAGELGHKWSDDVDRLKEELNDKEKAQNVKRAIKMEKMFGVAPPQTLYHTRAAHAPPPAGSSHAASASAGAAPPFLAVPQSPGSPTARNVNQSAYTRNKVRRGARPGTADSAEPLIDPHGNGRLGEPQGFSDIYEHYRHSLNSLNDIIDRDDRESLQRLHGIIHGDADAHAPLQEFARAHDESPSPSPPPTPRAERRRSLPTRASVASLASQYSLASVSSVATAAPEESAFQVRRRRAAKLTQFFGVDYRNLVNEVFESLELGLEEERGKGTLHPEEVAELLHKLRKLKTKRNSLFS